MIISQFLSLHKHKFFLGFLISSLTTILTLTKLKNDELVVAGRDTVKRCDCSFTIRLGTSVIGKLFSFFWTTICPSSLYGLEFMKMAKL